MVRARRIFNAIMAAAVTVGATIMQTLYGWVAFALMVGFMLVVVGWIFALAATDADFPDEGAIDEYFWVTSTGQAADSYGGSS